ncbi:MAG: hypothetical protein JNM56_35930 [Planctomycetia bacterium]|nr:hypothetical protein [Planctomycetia bacterium]
MQRFVIKTGDTNEPALCPLCGRLFDQPQGLQIALADGLTPVCLDCGRRHAAPLLSLIRLASSAERILWKGRPLMSLRLEEWLALENAAWNYVHGNDGRSHS